MKLISCYIQGFGALRDQRYDFCDTLNTFVLPNGAGKSTLAAFIKAMLYGMETTKINTFNERAHYLPFEGTVYGGSLTLEFQHDEYRIERTFGPKSQTDDVTRFYRNNELFSTEDIGYFFFALHRDSFVRSIFFGEEDATLEPTADISSRLNPFTGTDDGRFDKLVKRLEDAAKKYENQHGKGILPDLKREYRRTEASVRAQHEARKQLNALLEVRKAQAKKVRDCKALLQEHSNYRTRLAQWNAYRNEQAELEQTLQEMEGLRTRYGMPTPEEMRSAQADMQVYTVQKAKKDEAVFQKEDELQALQSTYPHGIPDEDTCDRLLLLAQKAEGFSTDAEALSAEEETALRNGAQRFASFAPADAQKQRENLRQIGSLTAALSAFDGTAATEASFLQTLAPEEASSLQKRARELLDDYQKAEAVLATPEPPKEKMPRYIPLLWAVGLLLCVGGIACLFVRMLWGMILLAVGVLSAGVGVLLWVLKQKANKKEAEKATLLREGVEQRRQQAQNELNSLLAPLGYTSKSPEDDVARLNTELDIWSRVRLQQKAQAEKKQAMAERCRILQEEASAFLAPFGLSADEAGLDRLCSEYDSFSKLSAKQQALADTALNRQKALDEINGAVNAICLAYGLPVPEDIPAAVTRYRRDRAAEEALANERVQKQARSKAAFAAMNDARQKLEALFGKYGVPLPPEEAWDELPFLSERYAALAKRAEALHTDLQAIRERYGLESEPLPPVGTQDEAADALARAEEALASTDRQIPLSEEQIEKLADGESCLPLLQEQIAQKQQEQKLLLAALAHLKGADEALRRQYIDPIRDRFCDYAVLIEETLGERVEMDNRFRLSFERNGMLRPDGHLSTGQRAICALCMRLALLDQMFVDEKPFLILDDPFMGLDDTHLHHTGALLKQISQKNQILYFCCHDSRNP